MTDITIRISRDGNKTCAIIGEMPTEIAVGFGDNVKEALKSRTIPTHKNPEVIAPILVARIRSTAPYIYRWGKDRQPGDPDVKKWSNILHHLSFREGFPVIGMKHENGQDLVIIDITEFGMKEDGRLVDYITLECELVEIRQVQ